MEQNARQQLYDWFMARPRALKAIALANKGLTALVYVLYVLLCLSLLWQRDLRLFRVLTVPATVFLTGSFMRAKINAPRPYENGGVPALFKKETKGKSFPSRHVFCAACISIAWLWIVPAAGILLCAVTLCIGVLRVIGGVHWPRDVLAGIAYGAGLAILGFYIL